MTQAPVVVVGAGISGVACARVLDEAGVPVVVLDRGHRIGGRMASRRVEDRPVDLGASYFTVSDDDLAAQAERWRAAGLAHPWTDTFHVLHADGSAPERKQGPVRWGAPGALRSLVEDLAAGLDVRRAEVSAVTSSSAGLEVDGQAARAVVLAMPDEQARRLLGPDAPETAALQRASEPVLALLATFAERTWDGVPGGRLDGAFVDGDPDLAWIADDGRRRGDDAPVLVAHTTAERARRHLDDPDAAAPDLLAALRRVLGPVGLTGEPRHVAVKRWSQARPAGEREADHLLGERLVGVCGDGWGPQPKVEGAWRSGRALGRALVGRLVAPTA